MSVWSNIESKGRKIGYARVSTKDQKLRMQLDGLNAVGCDLIFKDHGISGAKAKRPGLNAMLKELRDGDTVVVFKLDRLGRSVLNLSDLLVRFQQDGIDFCSMSEGINTTSPSGKLVFHIFSAVAEFHRDLIIENTIAGIEAARRRGKHIGRPYALTPDQVAGVHALIFEGKASIETAAARFRVHPATLKRAFLRSGLQSALDAANHV
tara:strand:- start:10521 stop:11144 length:624 start_codon:yes stop_codon:yes gene_type:complete